MRSPTRWLPNLLATDSRYRLAGWLFVRVLAIVYFAAFLSTALEITGLVGEHGILPAGEHLQRLRDAAGAAAWVRFPTLFWIVHSDAALLAVSYAGCAFAVLLLLGWRPTLSLVVLFALYLSLFKVGQIFFNFQWEYLLLEAGFLAIFIGGGPSRLLVFLFHWLLFRLRFLSGLAKLHSDDPSWAGLTTLNHYFETQPLPHIGAWYAHQLPDWLLRAGTGLTLFVELLVPFFIFLPRPFRLFAAAATILIQLLIIATSNHNFINLLTIALCLFLLDDAALRRLLPRRLAPDSAPHRPALARLALLPLVAALIVPTSLYAAWEYFGSGQRLAWDHPVNWVRGWGLGNVYHIFPTMQVERHELTIQGSHDAKAWQSYRFRYKPNAADERPPFIVPLHPRLDWMIWFIAPQNPAMRAWFDRFMWRLQQDAPAVTGLLAHNPFADRPPRHLRVLVHRYRFTSAAERRRSGRIWHVDYLGEFPRVPPRRP
ncbi:MAG: lipase maturation factor family protein [Gammaproteobacteria bacterium]|nr:lipase maturation factor family protein [Gammaproteobacteria bacterium]